MDARKIIADLGYEPIDAAIYMAVLEFGEAPASAIAKKAKQNRSTTYVHLKNLEMRGIVSSVERRGVQVFSAKNPVQLLELSELALRRARAALPDLEALAASQDETKPRVQYFPGIEGIKAVLDDTLTATEPIRTFSDADLVLKNLGKPYYEEYVARRVAKKIHTQAILNTGPIGESFKKQSDRDFRSVQLVPRTVEMPNEIKIYDDKVALMSHVAPFCGVLIKDAAIAKTLKSMFDMAWLYAEKYQVV